MKRILIDTNIYSYGSYPSGSVIDPTGPTTGTDRVLRGGNWDYDAGLCRVAGRDGAGPDFSNSILGFRLVCAPDH